jgi:hypothetical protein
MQYKVGDEVILKGKIVRVDEHDSRLPYKIQTGPNDFNWIGDGAVFAVVSGNGKPAEVEPAKPVFKVGDWVTSSEHNGVHGRGQIVEFDENDEDQPYRVKFSNGCHHWESTANLTPADGPTKAEPEPKRLTVGDWVTSTRYPSYGVGQIVADDHDILPYRVRFSNGEKAYHREHQVKPAEKPAEPETKFKVGDRVIHKIKPEWGVGVVKQIRAVDPGDGPDYVSAEEHRPMPRPYRVEYPKKRDGTWSVKLWWTAEENLVPVIE